MEYSDVINIHHLGSAMTIDKILKVEQVGRFKSLVAKGDVQFRRLTLLYGQNAHGKTTIAGIFRSLRSGDAAYIAERTTLGSSSQPHIEIRLSSGNVSLCFPCRDSDGGVNATTGSSPCSFNASL